VTADDIAQTAATSASWRKSVNVRSTKRCCPARAPGANCSAPYGLQNLPYTDHSSRPRSLVPWSADAFPIDWWIQVDVVDVFLVNA